MGTAAPAVPDTAADPVRLVPASRPERRRQRSAAVGASAAGSVGASPLAADPPSPAAISALDARLDLLVRLGAAYDSGVLTDAGFDRGKSRLMGV